MIAGVLSHADTSIPVENKLHPLIFELVNRIKGDRMIDLGFQEVERVPIRILFQLHSVLIFFCYLVFLILCVAGIYPQSVLLHIYVSLDFLIGGI